MLSYIAKKSGLINFVLFNVLVANIFRKATRLGKISEENLSPSTKEVEETEEDEPLPENATIADTNVLAEEQTPENKQLLEGPEQQVS